MGVRPGGDIGGTCGVRGRGSSGFACRKPASAVAPATYRTKDSDSPFPACPPRKHAATDMADRAPCRPVTEPVESARSRSPILAL